MSLNNRYPSIRFLCRVCVITLAIIYLLLGVMYLQVPRAYASHAGVDENGYSIGEVMRAIRLAKRGHDYYLHHGVHVEWNEHWSLVYAYVYTYLDDVAYMHATGRPIHVNRTKLMWCIRNLAWDCVIHYSCIEHHIGPNEKFHRYWISIFHAAMDYLYELEPYAYGEDRTKDMAWWSEGI